jgi:hypothetical protein
MIMYSLFIYFHFYVNKITALITNWQGFAAIFDTHTTLIET